MYRICNLCNIPKELKKDDCNCSLRESTKKTIEIKVSLYEAGKARTIIEGNMLSIKNWRKRFLKELKRNLHTNGFCKDEKIVLNGIHSPENIVKILENFP